MGAACGRMKQENTGESMRGNAEDRIPSHSMHGPEIRVQFSNGTRGRVLPSEKGNVQRVQGRYSMKPQKQCIRVNSQAEKLPESEKGKMPNDTCKESKRSNSVVLPAPEEEDICSTCLDGYDEENPKILTKCNHHYHLPCILEWKERSNTCPTCGKVLVIDEIFQGL